MTFGLTLYRLATLALSPFVPLILKARIRAGKENAARLNERLARGLPARPAAPLVWLHGASVGESLMLAAIGEAIRAERPGTTLLFTTQTQTSAGLLKDRLPAGSLHQMAPIDTPAIARRFIEHWQPDLMIAAESDLWPNLIRTVQAAGAQLALINARMTEKSLAGWRRWPATARALLSSFDTILAADERTAGGLKDITGRTISMPGNLKTALPPPTADDAELGLLRQAFISDRGCLLAASTHNCEEALVLDAWEQLLPRPALILAPRHPERGDEIETLLQARGHSFTRRTRDHTPDAGASILLADTMGEMGLWYRLADLVYLGGGHATGVGGHNPIEPIRLGRRVITGPHTFNFDDLMARLSDAGAVDIVDGADALAAAIREAEGEALPAHLLEDLEAESRAPLTATMNALRPLLPSETA